MISERGEEKLNAKEMAFKVLKERFAALSGSDVVLVSDSIAEQYIQICAINPEMTESDVESRLAGMLHHSINDITIVKLSPEFIADMKKRFEAPIRTAAILGMELMKNPRGKGR